METKFDIQEKISRPDKIHEINDLLRIIYTVKSREVT